MKNSFLIKNIELWNSDSVEKNLSLWVEDGILKKKISPLELMEFESKHPELSVIEGGGHVIMPSGVDNQVHLRCPGQSQKEIPETALVAALRGGVGALLTMPNTKPKIDTLEALELGRQEASKAIDATGVEVLWSAAISHDQKGESLVDFEALARAGVAAFTDDGVGVANNNVMKEALRRIEPLGLPLLQHAEVPGHGGVLAPGPTQRKLGLPAYPGDAEWKMVERDLRLLEAFPRARYHVLHVSCAETLRLVKECKNKGLRVSCEVSPHHLWLSSKDIPVGDTSYKMNPPLRQEEDRLALWEALSSGLIDFVATDHAPHEKELKGADFKTAAFGTTGLESFLRVLVTAHQEGKLSASRLVEVFSTAPASFLGIGDRFGSLKEGRPFMASWVDVTSGPRNFGVADLWSRQRNNCFLGRPLSGQILGIFTKKGFFQF